MSKTRFVGWMISVGLAVMGAATVSGQDYPNKPIRIVTSPAGSPLDFQTRTMAQGISGALGQAVIVENRPSGVIPGETVAKAAPDGYTLLYAGGALWITPLLQKTPYDAVKDFSPVALTTKAPNLLVVTSSLPVKSVKELVALAKARPGELNFSTAQNGGGSHLALELFKSIAGVSFLRVPYSNGTQETADLISGQVQLTIGTPASTGAHLKSGKLRALAVTSAQPSALFPELPTLAASGVPGYEFVSTYGVFAPAKTAAAFVNRLNQEIVRFFQTPEAKEKFLTAGLEVIGSSPDQAATTIQAEIARMSKVIKDAGIKAD